MSSDHPPSTRGEVGRPWQPEVLGGALESGRAATNGGPRIADEHQRRHLGAW